MKRTSYFLLVLTLLLTFAGCNQKGKKLEKIANGITQEQQLAVLDIMASALDLNLDPHYYYQHRDDTLIFGLVVDTLSEKEVEKITQGEQQLKNYLLTALCNESPQAKELLSQIAEVPAYFKLTYEDLSTKEKIDVILNPMEIEEVLVKDYKHRDVLENFFEWSLFNESDEKYNVSSCFEKINEKEYILVEYSLDNTVLSDIDERVNSDIDNAKDNFLFDIDDIVDLNEYKDKISKKYRNDYAEYVKENILEEGLFDNDYIPKLMQKTNVGFILRFKDNSLNKTLDIVIESNELLGEAHNQK